MNHRKYILPILIGFLMFLFSAVLCPVLVKGLGAMLVHFGNERFGKILSQIRSAEITLPLYLPAIAYGGFVYLVCRFQRSQNRSGLRSALFVLLGFLLFLLVTALTFLGTRVNGIRTGDVAASLIGYFRNGALDLL